MKSNVAKLALWLMLCLVASGLWLIGGSIVTSIVVPLLVNVPDEELEQQYIQFDADGNTMISAWNQRTRRRAYRDLDGRPLDLPIDKWPTMAKFTEFGLAAADTPMRVASVNYDTPALPWSFFCTPLPWDVRLMQAGWWTGRDSQFWIFVAADRPQGRGYFIVWNSTRSERIGYLGLKGLTQAVPPLDEQFPTFGNSFDEMIRFPLEGHSSTVYNMSETPSQFSGRSLFAISPARDRLFHIQLLGNTVQTIWSGPPGSLRDVFLRSQSSDQGAAMFLVLPDEFQQLDRNFQVIRHIRLPAELRGDPNWQQWIEPRPGEHVVVVQEGVRNQLRSKHRIVWFNDAGEVSQRRELQLRSGRHPAVIKAELQVGTIACANPLAAGVALLATSLDLLPSEETSSAIGPATNVAAASLRLARDVLWPSLLFVTLLSAGFVVVAQRRLKRIGATRFDQWAWTVFILLTGVVGYWAFLVHRRWRTLTRCPACGRNTPCSRTHCSACSCEFPAANPTGCEILG